MLRDGEPTECPRAWIVSAGNAAVKSPVVTSIGRYPMASKQSLVPIALRTCGSLTLPL
jgi:hypothetical protein